MNAFIGSVHEGVIIDDGFGFNQLIGLALDYRSFDPANLQAQTLPTVATNGFGSLGDVLTIDQPAAQQMLVNIFGSSLVTPTNPPPDANGYPEQPPPVTPTTAPPTTTPSKSTATTAPAHHHDDGAPVQPHTLHTELTRQMHRGGTTCATPATKRPPPPRRAPGPARSSSRSRT